MSRPARRPQDLQAVRRRRVPALRVRPLLRGHRRQGAFLANAALGLAQGRPGRGRRRPRRVRRLVRRDRVQPRPGALPGRRDAGGPRAPSSSTRSRPARACPRRKARAAVDAAIDRWVWYAGWTDKLAAGARRHQPGRRPVLRLLGARADRGGRRRSPRSSRPCSAWSACSPPVLAGRQHRRRRHLNGAPAAGGHPGRGAGHLRRPRRGGQPAHRRRRRDRARGSPRTPTSTRIDLAGAPAPTGDGARARGGRHLKRVLRAPADEPDWTADPGSRRMPPFLETKTVWHPIGV